MTTATPTKASTRTPSKNQVQVLAGAKLAFSDADDTPPDNTTSGIHAWRLVMGAKAPTKPKPPSTRETYLTLVKCHEYGWVEREIVDEKLHGSQPNDGAGLAWHLNEDGGEALGRGQAAMSEGGVPEEEPPAADAPYADPEALAELDADGTEDSVEDGGDVEVEEPVDEPDDVPVNPGASQLSLAIGGPKPKSSILKVNARQQKFGSTRQFKMGERIPIAGYIEVREVSVKQEANGHVVRTHKAVIAEFTLDGVELPDGDD